MSSGKVTSGRSILVKATKFPSFHLRVGKRAWSEWPRNQQNKLLYRPELSAPDWAGFYFIISFASQDDTAQVLPNQDGHLAWVSLPCLVHPLLSTKRAMIIPSRWFIWLGTNLKSRSHTGCDHSATEASRATHRCCEMHQALHIISNNCIWCRSFTDWSIGWTASEVISTLAKHLIWVGLYTFKAFCPLYSSSDPLLVTWLAQMMSSLH